MVVEYFGAATALKSTIDILRGLKGADAEEMRAAHADIIDKLCDARIDQLGLVERVAELEDQLRKIDDFDQRIARHRPQEIMPGFIAYSPDPPSEGGALAEHYCATCVGNRRFSLLQGARVSDGKVRRWVCPTCKTFSPEAVPFSGMGTIKLR